MNRYFLILCALIPITGVLNAQQLRDWTIQMNSPQVFIENQGQYDQLCAGTQYAIDHGFGWQVFFSPGKTTYLVRRADPKVKKENAVGGESQKRTIHESRISCEWIGANCLSGIQAFGETGDYYTYASGEGASAENYDHVKSFESIVYREIYPGISISWEAPEKGGVKYSITLAPGANPGYLRMKYTGATPVKDADGNIRLRSVLGEIIDHAPVAWYADNPSETIPVEFKVTGNEVSIVPGSYDHSRSIIIDPWTVNPALPAPFNRAFEVDCDNAGNVFVFGGGMGYNLKKYNAAGTLQWTHVSPWDTSNSWFGELLVHPVSGDVYITSGSPAKIRRLTAAGATTFTNNGPFFNLDEYWTLIFNCDRTKLVAGGTRIVGLTSPQGFIFDLNPGTGAIVGSPYNITPTFMNEVRSLFQGGDGHMWAWTNDNFVKLNTTFGTVWSIAGYGNAYYSPSYMANSVQGLNSIVANTNFLYTSNGAVLEKRDLTTGAVITSVALSGGGFTSGLFGTGPTNSGLAIDDCGNIYAGTTTGVYKYDANLTLLGSVASANVYDVWVAPSGVLLYSGNAFLTSNTTLAPCGQLTISCVVLPVELRSLSAICSGGKGVLRWETLSETDVESFVIERTTDGFIWETVGNVPCHHTANNYQWSEPLPANGGELFYRLQVRDINGALHPTGIVELQACPTEENNLRIFPPITADETEITIVAPADYPLEFSLMDAGGSVLEQKQVTGGNGEVKVLFSLGKYASGMYLIRVRGGGKILASGKVLKQ